MNRSRGRDNLFGRADSGPMPRADWFATTETIAWRRRLDAWIEDQRTDVSECRAFSSPIPDADMPSPLPIGRVAALPTNVNDRDAHGRFRRRSA